MVPSIAKISYVPLTQDNSEEEQALRVRADCWRFKWQNCALLVLVVLNGVWFWTHLAKKPMEEVCSNETSMTGIPTFPKIPTNIEWWSAYSVQNDSDPEQSARADAVWDEIKPAHGFVAVDPEWADDKGLLPSMELPSDTSKRVYIVEAYHMLHCLKIMRKTFYQVLRGEEPSFVLEHTSHCFDTLRQNIMCHADDTLLYTFGRARAGDGQERQCRDWTVLKDWATEHTACYLDHEDKPGGRFWRCDEGDDGLIVGSARLNVQ